MNKHYSFATIFIMFFIIFGACGLLRGQDVPAKAFGSEFPSWHFSLGGGGIVYEGDEATKGGLDGLLRIGYDYTPRWTFRFEISYFPELKANTVYDYESGVPVPRPGLHGDSTWAAGLDGDVLFHFIAAEDRRWDPYLIGGIGLLHYEKMREWRSQTDIPIRAGVGLAYHFTPAWAVNIDVMEQMTIDKTEFNFIPSAGISWSPFGRQAARPAAVLTPVAPGALPLKTAPAPVPVDLQKFELVMNFTDGQWQIHPEYFMELDAIAKIVQQHPGSDVLIEGHIDQQPKASEKDAQKLTGKRANALRDYFIKKHNISRKRVKAIGYGFSQPKKPNDPIKGNPENRRMTIHISAAPATR